MNQPLPRVSTLAGNAHIRVTIRSHAMISLADLCAKAYRRSTGILLIVPPEDALELDSFVRALATRVSTAEPFTVEPGSASLLWSPSLSECCHADCGVFIRQAGIMTETMRQDLALLVANLKQSKLIIARFSSEVACREGTAGWSPALKKMFTPKPMVWPALSERCTDLDGLVGSICVNIAEQEGHARQIPVLTDQAMLELRSQRHRNVASLYAKIRSACNKIRREKIIAIKPRHLHSSRPPNALPAETSTS